MTLVSGRVQEAAPTAAADTSSNAGPLSQSKHNGLWTLSEFPDDYGPLMRGQCFRACNPTPGTGIAMSITTAFSATAALAILRNAETLTGAAAKTIILRSISLKVTVAPASATSTHVALMLDPTSTSRYSSGGSALTPVNANSGYATGSIAQVYFGAITATAASSGVRNVDTKQVKTQSAPSLTIGDEILLTTRNTDFGAGVLSGSAPVRIVVPISPVAIAPGHSLLVHMWNPANATTPPSFECAFAWWER